MPGSMPPVSGRRRIIAHRVRPESVPPTRPGHHRMDRSQVSEMAYNLGWDMAHYGIRPREYWQAINEPLMMGWTDGDVHFGTRTLPVDAFSKKWLRLRGSALNRGKICHESVTADYLRKIAPRWCPILRTELRYDGAILDPVNESDLIWSVDRIDNDGAYIAGNLAVMSEKANRAKGNLVFAGLYAMQQQALAQSDSRIDGLSANEWGRLSDLGSMINNHSYDWRDLVCRTGFVMPPTDMYVHGAAWQMKTNFSILPWQRLPRQAAQRWANKFKEKKTHKLALEAAKAYFQACYRLDTKQNEWRWIAEDAWANPAFRMYWKKFIDRLSEADLCGIVKTSSTAEEILQWRRDAGLLISDPG